jgi:hypothetical protein
MHSSLFALLFSEQNAGAGAKMLRNCNRLSMWLFWRMLWQDAIKNRFPV